MSLIELIEYVLKIEYGGTKLKANLVANRIVDTLDVEGYEITHERR